jgi:plastocyanin
MFSEAQYQPCIIITILIFGFLIDKKCIVPQLLTYPISLRRERKLPATTANILTALGPALIAALLAVSAGTASADDTLTLSLTIKDHRFEPAEVHAPAGKPIALQVKNLGSTAAEFESSVLHVEKVVAAGAEATIRVRPLEPGRYKFFDDFHRATEGFLVVP